MIRHTLRLLDDRVEMTLWDDLDCDEDGLRLDNPERVNAMRALVARMAVRINTGQFCGMAATLTEPRRRASDTLAKSRAFLIIDVVADGRPRGERQRAVAAVVSLILATIADPGATS